MPDPNPAPQPQPVSDADIAEILRLDAEATQAPWVAWEIAGAGAAGPPAHGNIQGPNRIFVDKALLFAPADAALIALSRNVVVALCYEVQAARHVLARRCPECLGSGTVTKSYAQGEHGDLYQEPCEACVGTGIVLSPVQAPLVAAGAPSQALAAEDEDLLRCAVLSVRVSYGQSTSVAFRELLDKLLAAAAAGVAGEAGQVTAAGSEDAGETSTPNRPRRHLKGTTL